MSKKRTREIAGLSIAAVPSEVRKALAFVGLFTRVAEREGLSLGHVVHVAKGKRTSQRVLDAIAAEVRRIERGGERAA